MYDPVFTSERYVELFINGCLYVYVSCHEILFLRCLSH